MKKLILGIILCVVPMFVSAALIVPMILSLTNDDIAFLAPGELEVAVEEPGKYYVWNEYRTVYEGRTYSRSKELPDGVTFTLTDLESGDSLPLVASGSMSKSSGGEQNISVGYFEIEDPGTYLLAIQGVEEPRVFSFGESMIGDFASFFLKMMLGGLLGMASIIGGILLIIFGIIEISRKGKSPPPMPSTSKAVA